MENEKNTYNTRFSNLFRPVLFFLREREESTELELFASEHLLVVAKVLTLKILFSFLISGSKIKRNKYSFHSQHFFKSFKSFHWLERSLFNFLLTKWVKVLDCSCWTFKIKILMEKRHFPFGILFLT